MTSLLRRLQLEPDDAVTARLVFVERAFLVTDAKAVVTQRLQILPAGSPLSGPAVVRAVVAEQGPGGLMRGTTATLVAYVPYSAVWFGSYECAKRAGGGLVASGDSQGSGVHMLHAGSGAKTMRF